MSMGRVTGIFYLMLVYIFIYTPILVLVVFSFNDGISSASLWNGFTLKWYAALLHNHQLFQTTINSLMVASVSATVATIIGTTGSLSFFRFNYGLKNLNFSLLYIVMMSPDIIMSVSLLVLFMATKIPLGFVSLLITHITFSLPFVVITVSSRLAGFDKNLVEAATDLGATEFQTFRHIIMPLLLPAILAGWLLSFTISMDDVIGSSFVTGVDFETLPLLIESKVRVGVKPDINALSTVIFALSIVIITVSQMMLSDKTAAKKR